MKTSRTFALIAKINELDLQHRSGWRPSEIHEAAAVGVDLLKEAKELQEALEYELASRAFPDLGVDRGPMVRHIKEEIGDVYAVLLQIVRRMGMSFQDLENESIAKLRMRFEGAEGIEI